MEPRRADGVAVRDRWLASEHNYFKIVGHNGDLTVTRDDPTWMVGI
jgi:hypothetical protein